MDFEPDALAPHVSIQLVGLEPTPTQTSDSSRFPVNHYSTIDHARGYALSPRFSCTSTNPIGSAYNRGTLCPGTTYECAASDCGRIYATKGVEDTLNVSES